MSTNRNKKNGFQGPLRVCAANPRYFSDESGRPVYLTGTHTWGNFKNMGKQDPPPEFDYEAYLDLLADWNHNFIRLWTWELARFVYEKGTLTYVEPFPWARTGPGNALDGKPKFDLNTFHQPYFERLRDRVLAAGERGMYVAVMLFEGHGLHGSLPPWCWDGHPFNAANNVNGIDGDPDGDGRGLETHMLAIPRVTALQEAYVRKVIETLNDLDNLLYEICNESGSYSIEWQHHMIDFIHHLEAEQPNQHPVGMTFPWRKNGMGTHEDLLKSRAEWISPFHTEGYRDAPPAADGSKVILTDTDHLWGIPKDDQIQDAVAWVWKSLCRGLNPIFMDPYHAPEPDRNSADTAWTEHTEQKTRIDMRYEQIRRDMGKARRYADRMNLAKAVPHNQLASTEYCLANPGTEYLAYLPDGGTVTLDLSAANGELAVEWFDPSNDAVTPQGTVPGGACRELTAPFEGHAVLFVSRQG